MEFDISKIKFSYMDRRRGVVIPTQVSESLAEFVGILIGDGYLHSNKKKYTIGVVGSPKTDVEYFTRVQNLIQDTFGLTTKIHERERALRLVFGSKAIFTFLTNTVGLAHGPKKGEAVTIPKSILLKELTTNAVLRGIFDTDGSIFFSDKKGSPNYPTIELTTTSGVLATQIAEILAKKGYRVRPRKHRPGNNLVINRVALYGKKNMKRWFEEIGFTNPIKQRKLIQAVI